jgi:acetoin utilization deacetylase AcuC-like enzyme
MMKVVFHENFYRSYTMDPAAATGRIEAIVKVIRDKVQFVQAIPATEEDIAAVHTQSHIAEVTREGLYDIAALAAGGAMQAAEIGLKEPCFGLIRPPGHHASANSAWGFCFFSNMPIALERLKREGKIETALVVDVDLHFGDGTVNILGGKDYVSILNPKASDRGRYIDEIKKFLDSRQVDIIGISAGFDHHEEDWGGLLATSDYKKIGRLVKETAARNKGGYFAILEGGYNHQVLGNNVMALIEGMEA